MLNPDNLRIYEGKSTIIKAMNQRSGINPELVEWSIADTTLAIISDRGKVFAKKAGKTTIKGVYNSDSAMAQLTIMENRNRGKLFIAPRTIFVKVEDSIKVFPVIDCRRVPDSLINWASLTDTILKVNDEGWIIGLKPGIAKLMAVYNNDTAYCKVEVRDPAQRKVKSRIVIIEIGETRSMFEARDTVTTALTHIVEDTSIVKIDDNYNMIAISVGETIVKVYRDTTLKRIINVLVVDEGTRKAVADSIRQTNKNHIRIKFNNRIRKKHDRVNLCDSINIEVLSDTTEVSLDKSATIEYTATSAEITDDGRAIEIELNKAPSTGEILLFTVAGGIADEEGNDTGFELVLNGTSQSATYVHEIINPVIDFNLFPNPSKSGILNLNASKSIATISVYTISGIRVYKTKINANHATISTPSLPQGMYSVKVRFRDGSVAGKKLIIQ